MHPRASVPTPTANSWRMLRILPEPALSPVLSVVEGVAEGLAARRATAKREKFPRHDKT